MRKSLRKALPMLFVGLLFALQTFSFRRRWGVLMVLLFVVSAARGQIYVSATGNDGNDGKTPASAKATLVGAIAVINSETVPYIKLGAGTFVTVGVAVPPGVRVVGEGAAQTTLEVTANSIALQSGSSLSNVTVTRTPPASEGGAPSISVSTYSGSNKITIKNVRFVGNRTGIYLQGSNHVIVDNEFENNRTGLVIDPSGTPSVTGLVLERNRFYRNRSYAAIFLGPIDNALMTENVSARIAHNDFIGNLAGGIELNANTSADKVVFIGNYFDQTNNAILTQRTNGGFTVNDHNVATTYPYNFTDNNVAADYPSAVSGANTAGVTVVGTLNAASPNGHSFGNPLISSTSPSFSNYVFIQDAIDYSNNGSVLQLAEGIYDERVVINKSLTIDGQDKTKAKVVYTGPAISGTGGGIPSLFTVSATNVTVKNISFTVDLVKLHSAVHSYGNVSGIVITDNNFVAKATGVLTGLPAKLAYTRRNAVGINIDGYDADYTNLNTGITGVTIQRNTVDGLIGGNAANGGFRGGFQVDRAKDVLIGGDNPSDGNTVQTINHDIISRFFVDGDVTVKNNKLNGGGLEMSSTNNAAGTVTIEANNFNGALSNSYTSQARFQANTNNKAFVLKNNTFSNTKWGVSIENFRNLTVEGNNFNPSVDDFRLITVNTKMILSSDAGATFPISLDVRSNLFKGLSTANLGKAIAFYNHKEDGTNNYQAGDIKIGSVGAHNTFDENIPIYIYVDNNNNNPTKTGSSPNFTSLLGFPEYGNNIAVTTTGYWKKDIRVDENQFFIGGQLISPFDMNSTQRTELEGKIIDKKDDGSVGEVQYYFPVTNLTTSVKYSSIQSAINAAAVGNEITTLPGEYLEDVTVNKTNLKLIGPGAALATIKGVKGGGATTLSVAATGAVVEGFTITREGNTVADWNNANGVLNNQGVSMDANNTTVRKLIITGNRNGLYINNRQNVLVEYCDIDNNRTGIQAVNNISGTIIRNNNITNNWTLGFLFLDIAGGQTTDIDVVKNNITGNWYSQVEFRGANTNVLNFGANYLGGAIVVTNTGSAEPGYSSLIPVVFGGSSSSPGGAYLISGLNANKVDYSVSLPSYTDTDGAIGFQPDSTIVWVNEVGPTATVSPRLTTASKIVAANGTIMAKDAIISSGGTITKNVTLDVDAASLTVNGNLTVNTTEVTLAKETVINGNFTLSAGKVTPASTFTIGGNVAATPGISNFINGAVTINNVNADILVPVGKNNRAAYVGLTSATGAATAVTVEYFPSAYSNLNKDAGLTSVSSNEYWSVSSSGGLQGNVRLYSYDLAASGLFTVSLPDAVVARYDGAKWVSLGNGVHSAGVESYVGANTSTTDFGYFTFGSATAVLPITLISFSAQATTGGALVKWSTANEENNAKFEVEKSLDGKNFFVIDTKEGKGNSITVSNYEFLDAAFKQSAYYRLVDVSASGKRNPHTAFTKFVKGLDNSLSVVTYPNPVTTKLFVSVGSANKENVKVSLVDLTGKTLKVKTADSSQPIELDVAGIATGSYILQVIKDSGNVSKKIVKL